MIKENVEINKKDVQNFFDELLTRWDNELISKDQKGLESYWVFKYDPKKSVEWNTYEFMELLYFYKNKCKQWEMTHNGGSCIVERVRDKYILPKIENFLREIKIN